MPKARTYGLAQAWRATPGRGRNAKAGMRPGISMRSMSALPADLPQHEDPLDPERILAELPEAEQGFFPEAYREAVEQARDPAGWKQLQRVLRRWGHLAVAMEDPGYQAALEAARGPVSGSGGMLLEDTIRVYRPAR